MKVQVLYASRTGCTKRLAQAIYEAVPGEKSIHDLAQGLPPLDGDIVLVGYWGVSGGPDPETRAQLQAITGKAVGVFCTLGYYCDTAHGRKTLETGLELVRDRNEILGGFVANGAVAKYLMTGQGRDGTGTPTEQKELRWDTMKNHPTPAECALAAERFSERIALYTRARELGIPFTSIL